MLSALLDFDNGKATDSLIDTLSSIIKRSTGIYISSMESLIGEGTGLLLKRSDPRFDGTVGGFHDGNMLLFNEINDMCLDEHVCPRAGGILPLHESISCLGYSLVDKADREQYAVEEVEKELLHTLTS